MRPRLVQDWTCLRLRMVDKQLRRRGIKDARLLEAMAEVPRHEFIPNPKADQAYADEPAWIGLRQTISQPYMVAAMIELLELRGQEKVLEVGAGSGYAAAVMARLAAHVYAIEVEPLLARRARQNLARTGLARNVTVVAADGTLGYPRQAPFQAISVAAAAPEVPQTLVDQLDPGGGRLVIPVGGRGEQRLQLIRKQGADIETRLATACRFVPLLGVHGWKS